MQPAIGILGGSGFYDLPGATVLEVLQAETPFGAPSDALTIAEVGARRVIFLPRHGRGHRLLPSEVNARAKKLVRVGASNAGDWDVGSAPGLEGDKIVWTGDFSGAAGRMGYRHTFTKKSDKEWSHTLEIKDPSGKFVPVSEVDCKR